MTDEKRQDTLGVFSMLVMAYSQGSLRFTSARLVFELLFAAALRYKVSEEVDIAEHPYYEVLKNVRKIKDGDLNAFEYVGRISHLTYATTLFDTFLSDCTHFLFLLHPKAIGKNQAVTLESVLGANSRTEIINQAALRKVRDIGFLSFSARVEFLKTTFGLKFDLDEQTEKQLERAASRRNTVTHDQGIFELNLNDDETPSISQKANAWLPTPVTPEEIIQAVITYHTIVAVISRSVITQVLKVPIDPSIDGLLQHLESFPPRDAKNEDISGNSDQESL
jgi:hypothetical protein